MQNPAFKKNPNNYQLLHQIKTSANSHGGTFADLRKQPYIDGYATSTHLSL